jgi:hypothetical protein
MSQQRGRMAARIRQLPPMKVLYVGLIVVATTALFGHVIGSWAADWAPNVATEAIAILVTVAVVDRIVRGRERARLKPRVDRAMREVGLSFQWMTRMVAMDYAQTHRDTFEAVPADSLGVLDHWIQNADREDTGRRGLEDGDAIPIVVNVALDTAGSLKRSRDNDRDVLEPDVVAQIDDFEDGARMAYTIYLGMNDVEVNERARIAIAEVVDTTHKLGETIIRHDPRWLEDQAPFLGAAPDAWGTDVWRRDSESS